MKLARALPGIVAATLLLMGAEARAGSAPQQNARCEKCHQQIAEEWRSSRHHQSFTNDEFRRALAREGKKEFCIGCHAPEAAKRGAPTQAEAELGVGCDSCHRDAHGVLAAPRADEDEDEDEAPHPVTRSANLTSSSACRRCHEFRFETPRIGAPAEKAQWMQRTWTEHHDGTSQSDGCGGCHLPRVAGPDGTSHASHRFRGGHDPAFVKSALDIRAERVAASSVEVVLTPRHVTHAVPTGDLFRRLMLTAETQGGARVARYLSRHHERTEHDQRVETSDDRPRLGPTRIRLELGPEVTRHHPIRVRVAYQRVDYLMGDDESRAVVSGEIELSDLTLEGEGQAAKRGAPRGPTPIADWLVLSPLLLALAWLRPRRSVPAQSDGDVAGARDAQTQQRAGSSGCTKMRC